MFSSLILFSIYECSGKMRMKHRARHSALAAVRINHCNPNLV
jgi:hypothetical protein